MSVSLTWVEPVGAEGYRVYRDTSPIVVGSLPSPLATVDAPNTTYEDTTAAVGTTYYYRVSAFAGAEEAVGAQVTIDASATQGRIALAESDLAFGIPDNLLLSGDAQAGGDLLLF